MALMAICSMTACSNQGEQDKPKEETKDTFKFEDFDSYKWVRDLKPSDDIGKLEIRTAVGNYSCFDNSVLIKDKNTIGAYFDYLKNGDVVISDDRYPMDTEIMKYTFYGSGDNAMHNTIVLTYNLLNIECPVKGKAYSVKKDFLNISKTNSETYYQMRLDVEFKLQNASGEYITNEIANLGDIQFKELDLDYVCEDEPQYIYSNSEGGFINDPHLYDVKVINSKLVQTRNRYYEVVSDHDFSSLF